MPKNKVQIVIEVDDATKKGLKNVKDNFKELGYEVDSVSKATKQSSVSFRSLVGSIAVANVAAQAATMAVRKLRQQVQQSITDASNYQRQMAGLSSVSAAFGESQEEARQAAMDLTKDGLITFTTAAQGLKNLMAGGLNLDQSIDLMEAYKDEAAFGRAETIEYDQAVGNLAESFLTENAMIGNLSGQQENYSKILEAGAKVLGKKTSELNESERALAKYEGTLIVAGKAEGDAARYAETFAGAQGQLRTTMYNLRVAIGTALLPALKFVNQSLIQLFGSAQAGSKALVSFAKVAVGIIGGIRATAQAIFGLAKSIYQIHRLQFGKVKDTVVSTYENIKDTVGSTTTRIGQITKDSLTGAMDVTREAAKRLGDFLGDTTDKATETAKKAADELESYKEKVDDLNKSFQQNLKELVIGHREKRQELEEDIRKENEEYREKLDDRKADHKRDMDEMARQHKDKVEDIKEDIKEEEHQVELAEKKKAAFRDDKYNEDIRKHKLKVADLKEKLAEENKAYKRDKQETIRIYKEETAEIKEEHNERLSALQEELDKEIEIYQKHKEDFDRLKDEELKDDITRLKLKHEAELAQLRKSHEEKMNEIKGYNQGKVEEMFVQGRKEQEAYNKGREFKGGEETTRAIEEQERVAREEVKVVGGGFGGGGGGAWEAPKTSAPEVGVFWQALDKGISWLKRKVPFFQDGGVVPGRKGEPTLAVVHGGETILPTSGGGNRITNNNFKVDIGMYAGSAIEKRKIAMQLWNEVMKVANSRNKSPTEVLN